MNLLRVLGTRFSVGFVRFGEGLGFRLFGVLVGLWFRVDALLKP